MIDRSVVHRFQVSVEAPATMRAPTLAVPLQHRLELYDEE